MIMTCVVNIMLMQNSTITSRQDFEQQSIDDRKQRLLNMKTRRYADMYRQHGFNMHNLDEPRLIQRAREQCDVDTYIDVQDCYVNNSLDDVRVQCDFTGLVVMLNLMKYFINPGDDVMIPVGAAVFVGKQKDIKPRSNRPTNVQCKLNMPIVSYISNVRLS